MQLSFGKATNRNTEAYWVEVGNAKFFISYTTVIAACTRYGPTSERARLANSWGPTTGKHMNDMGVRDWPVLEDKEFEEFCDRLLVRSLVYFGRQLMDDEGVQKL